MVDVTDAVAATLKTEAERLSYMKFVIEESRSDLAEVRELIIAMAGRTIDRSRVLYPEPETVGVTRDRKRTGL